MAEDKRDPDGSKQPEPGKTERPRVPLHDPFARFDFEPTDGGEF